MDSDGSHGAEKTLLSMVQEQLEQGLEPMILSAGEPGIDEKPLEAAAKKGVFVTLWRMMYIDRDGTANGDGCSAYIKYEKWQCPQETQVGSVVGVDCASEFSMLVRGVSLRALFLAPKAGIYTLAALGYAGFLLLAWQGHKKEKEGKSLSALYSIPYYFMLLNLASYKACVAFLKGEKKVIWNPRKG